MKLLSDFFPILLFFIAYKLDGIYTATAVAIAASFIQVGIFWFKNKRFETTHLITLVLVTIFGGATLYFQDDTFIKWKPTIINWLFGLAFLISQFIGKQPLIKRMMGSSITIPKQIWSRLNSLWVGFFFLSGGINLYVMSQFDTDTWVNFKMYGMLGLTISFIVLQGFYLMKYIEVANENE